LVEARNAIPGNIIPVTNTNDSGPGSLRGALAIANDGDTIDATGVSGIVLLTSGTLQITHNVTVNGPSAESLAIDGDHTFRVFENFASNVTISGLTISNGLAADGIGGSGVLNHNGLTVSDSRIVENGFPFGFGGGGGVFSDAGTLTVTNSVIDGNAAAAGGGISSNGATVTVIGSTISGNNGSCYGGGIASIDGQLTVIDSTISGNSSFGWAGLCEQGNGGGMFFYNGGILSVTNSTISGNSTSEHGGGMTLGGNGTTIIEESTISDNSGPQGGGIFNYAMLRIRDTVLKAGEFGPTILNYGGGSVTSLGYNLASDEGGGVLRALGDQINTDPMLGPLQDNGGSTFTHSLLPGSPAINAGDPSFTPPPFSDQRGLGFARVAGGRIDIGSFEVQGSIPTPTPTATASPRPTPANRPRPTPAPRL
jgi:hypothetical protein